MRGYESGTAKNASDRETQRTKSAGKFIMDCLPTRRREFSRKPQQKSDFSQNTEFLIAIRKAKQ